MASYRDTVNDDYGRPIPGVLVYVFDKSGALATLDNGQANPITTDVLGSFAFSVVDGVYALEFRFAGVTRRQDNVIIGNPAEYKGDTGDTGPANSTYTTRRKLELAPVTNRSYNFAPDADDTSGWPAGAYFFTPGDFSGAQYAADFTTGLKVKLDAVPLTTGALVRQGAKSVAYQAPGATVTVDQARHNDLRPTTPQELRGVPNDGSATVHAAFLALESTNRDMIVPPGDYLYDNSVFRLIHYYTGEITFAPGARLIATDATKPLLYFVGGSPKVRGLTCTTRDDPATVGRQNNSAMLRFDDTTDAICSDVVIERGAGAGVLVLRGTGFRGNNIVVRNTLADGFDFFNASDFTLSDLLTFNTGDDGLGIVSYADGPAIFRGTLSSINVRQTGTRGISFVGCTNVTLNGFLIEETQGDGIIVERDDTSVTHTPTGVRVMNGVIKRAGQRVVDPSYTGEKHGLKVGQSGTVDIIGVTIVDAKSRGLSATSSEVNAHLYTDGVRVETAGDEGFFVYQHRSWTYGTITSVDTRVEGVRTLSVDRLIGGKRIVIRASKGGGSFRAISDVNNAYQDTGEAYIEDLRGPATGFTYRVEGDGRGSIGTVQWNQSGAFYSEFLAPYMTIPDRVTAKRDDVSPGTGDILLSPLEAWDRKIYAALTSDIVVGLPTFGMAHGDEVSVSRYDGSGTYTVSFQDRNNGNVVVTTIPPGTPMINRAWWDAVASRWRARGKTNL